MAWANPRTYVTGEIVTAAHLNETRDNLLSLDSFLGQGIVNFAEDATGATTVSSTSYAADSPAVAVTCTTGTSAWLEAQASVEGPTGAVLNMSYAVSGASTIAAADARSQRIIGNANAVDITLTRKVTGLTAGSNTFTLHWKVASGSAFPNYRRLAVFPIR